jgi:hypothetical protein
VLVFALVVMMMLMVFMMMVLMVLMVFMHCQNGPSLLMLLARHFTVGSVHFVMEQLVRGKMGSSFIILQIAGAAQQFRQSFHVRWLWLMANYWLFDGHINAVRGLHFIFDPPFSALPVFLDSRSCNIRLHLSPSFSSHPCIGRCLPCIRRCLLLLLFLFKRLALSDPFLAPFFFQLFKLFLALQAFQATVAIQPAFEPVCEAGCPWCWSWRVRQVRCYTGERLVSHFPRLL